MTKHFSQGGLAPLAAVLALAVAVAWLGCPSARADLVWTPDGGWQVEGGVLGPLFGDMGASKSALEAMNKAKAAQVAGHYWSALSQYDQVISRLSRLGVCARGVVSGGVDLPATPPIRDGL